jgi:hypothetical protein
MATAAASTYGEFTVGKTDRAPGLILPQKLGTKLWAPMLVMAVMAFPIAAILGIVRGSILAGGVTASEANTVAALGQYTTAVMFIGFATVFSAIVFAIARILGALRTGGGRVQEAAGGDVLALKMPGTAKLMIVLMAMAMMGLMIAVIIHIVLGVQAGDGEDVAAWATWVEGLRRFSVAVYLVSIGFGLATIITVLRFQAQRLRNLVAEQE